MVFLFNLLVEGVSIMLKVYIEDHLMTHKVNIWIIDERPEGPSFRVKPMKLIMESILDDGSYMEPSLQLERRLGQQFLTELASALILSGYRDKTDDNKAEVKRLENHLQDMQKVAFGSLETMLEGVKRK
jgi:hypothetical protein